MKKFILLNLVIMFGCIQVFCFDFPVEFIKITENIWIHKSYEYYLGYKASSNGLIIETKNSVVLIDTAWNNEETKQIVSFIKKEIAKPVIACIISHFHEDRSGGLREIQKNRIPIYLTQMTYELLKNASIKFNPISLNHNDIIFDNTVLEIDYYGAAHSQDNIVVYYPKYNLLYGGCSVKSMDSKGLGNIDDADTINWPKVITNIKKKHHDCTIVIPGHGNYGGIDLLDHTLSLFE